MTLKLLIFQFFQLNYTIDLKVQLPKMYLLFTYTVTQINEIKKFANFTLIFYNSYDIFSF